MRSARILFLVCFLTVTGLAQAKATLVGSVREMVWVPNPAEKTRIATGAVVTLTSKKDKSVIFTATTDASGAYRFDGVPAGGYVLFASRPVIRGVDMGTRIETRETIDLKAGDTRTKNLTLLIYVDVACGTLAGCPPIRETVTVSADLSQTVDQVSKTIDVINGQEMRDRADFSLAETLKTIPGFRVQQLGGFGRTATIKTRGLRNQDTAILIDGIRFRDASAITGDASPFISDFTLTSVARIEVLRGSGSSLYGTNAVGGTVDFKTPGASAGTHGQIGGAFGGLGLGRFRGNISHGLANGKFGINAAVSRTAYTRGIDGQDNAYNTNFQTRFDANPSSKTSISGRIFLSDADVRLNTGPDTAGLPPASNALIINAVPNVNFTPDANDPDSFQRSRFLSGQFVVNQVINNMLVLGGYYHRLTTKRTNDNGVLGPPFDSASTSVFDGTIHTGNAHVNWTPNEANQVTAGYEFESEKLGNTGTTPSGTGNFFTRARQSSNTLYVQDLVSLLQGRLQLAGGARFQWYSLTSPAFSLTNAPYQNLTFDKVPMARTFDGSASYFFMRSGTKMRAHVGNGYRVPSLYERLGTFFSTFGTPSFIAIGDPFLKPEKTIAFDAGVEQNAFAERLRLSATYFYTRLTDVIGFGNSVPNIGSTTRPFGGYENQKGGLARGGEFSAKVKATSSTDIFMSYTFTNSDQRAPQVTGNANLKTLGIPDHQFTLVATQRFRRLWVNFDFLATSSYLAPVFSNSSFNTYIFRFDGNRKGDLTAGYTFGFRADKLTLRLYGTVENIFDQEYYENGFRTAGATGRFGLSFGF